MLLTNLAPVPVATARQLDGQKRCKSCFTNSTTTFALWTSNGYINQMAGSPGAPAHACAYLLSEDLPIRATSAANLHLKPCKRRRTATLCSVRPSTRALVEPPHERDHVWARLNHVAVEESTVRHGHTTDWEGAQECRGHHLVQQPSSIYVCHFLVLDCLASDSNDQRAGPQLSVKLLL